MKGPMLFAPLGALVVLAGYLGLSLGAPLTETDVISTFAKGYVAQTGQGARETDCVGLPHPEDGVWLVVHCTHPDGRVMSGLFDAAGRVILRPSGPRA